MVGIRVVKMAQLLLFVGVGAVGATKGTNETSTVATALKVLVGATVGLAGVTAGVVVVGIITVGT